MAGANDELVKVSAAFAATHPQLWDRFVAAHEVMYWKMADDTVSASSENVQSMQGAARQARLLHDIYKTCRETAAKLTK